MAPQDARENRSKGLRLYLAIRSMNRGPRQLLLVGVPFLLIFLWIALVSPFLSFHFGYVKWFGTTTFSLTHLPTWLAISLPAIILFLAGVHFLLHTSQAFVCGLYHPPSETESEIKERIWHRLWGLQGLSFYNYIVIKDTQLAPNIQWSTWLGGPTYLIINDGAAVYLERGNRFSRVVGAGFPVPHLNARETIKAVVDLRPQTRRASVSAWTNDGIKVTIKVQVEFQIESNPVRDSSNSKLVYSFDPQAVCKAVEYTAVRMREGKLQEVDWREGTMGSVTGLLAHHISSHRLDELFIRNQGDGQMLSLQVISTLLEKSDKRLREAIGVHVTSLQIIEVSTPSEIRHQRLNVWGAQKDSLITRIQGEAQAYKIRTIEEARAKAQRDLIVAITKSLGRVDDPSRLPEPLLLSLSGILDQGLKDPLVQTYMARETLDALARLKDLLTTDSQE